MAHREAPRHRKRRSSHSVPLADRVAGELDRVSGGDAVSRRRRPRLRASLYGQADRPLKARQALQGFAPSAREAEWVEAAFAVPRRSRRPLPSWPLTSDDRPIPGNRRVHAARERRARKRRLALAALAERVLEHHDRRRRNPGDAAWIIRAGGVVIVYDLPDGRQHSARHQLVARIASLRRAWNPRATTRPTVTSRTSASDPRTARCGRRKTWGLRDYDEQSGDLVGLEVWSASKVLPDELVAALPRLDGRGTSIERQPA